MHLFLYISIILHAWIRKRLTTNREPELSFASCSGPLTVDCEVTVVGASVNLSFTILTFTMAQCWQSDHVVWYYINYGLYPTYDFTYNRKSGERFLSEYFLEDLILHSLTTKVSRITEIQTSIGFQLHNRTAPNALVWPNWRLLLVLGYVWVCQVFVFKSSFFQSSCYLKPYTWSNLDRVVITCISSFLISPVIQQESMSPASQATTIKNLKQSLCFEEM